MSMGSIIRKRREERNLTQDQVSVRVGISKPYLSNIETERVHNPPSDRVLTELEKALGFSTGELLAMAHQIRTPSDVRVEHENLSAEVEKLRGMLKQLLGEKGRGKTAEAMARKLKNTNVSDMLSAGRSVPIINRVMAGYPHHFTDLDYPPSVADEYVRCPDVHDPQAFAARVVGDSMQPRYAEGDVVIFAPNTQARTGDDCFVRFAKDNSTTFKRLITEKGGKLRLQPLNDKYPAEVYDPDDFTGLWPAVMRIEKLRR